MNEERIARRQILGGTLGQGLVVGLLVLVAAPARAQPAVAPDVATEAAPPGEPLAPEPPTESQEVVAAAPPELAAPAPQTSTLPEPVPAGTLDEASSRPESAEPGDAPPNALAVGEHGVFKPGALLQFWALGSHRDGESETTFRIRRAELKIFGEIYPELIAYKLMIDPAKALEFDTASLPVEGQEPAPDTPGEVVIEQPSGSTSIFQDLEIGFLTSYADVTVGQFKIPLSLEGYNSSSKLIFPERALVAKKYGDRRDIGLKIDKKIGPIYYYLGLFNGSGQNRLDTNDQKDLAARVEVEPILGLLFGAAGYASLGERDQPTTRDRVEADVRLDVANVLVQGEYLHGWDGAADADRTEGHGFYAALGYTFFGRLQPVARVGFVDADVAEDVAAGGTDEVWHYEIGANYNFDARRARLALSASLFDFDDSPSETVVILAAQLSF